MLDGKGRGIKKNINDIILLNLEGKYEFFDNR